MENAVQALKWSVMLFWEQFQTLSCIVLVRKCYIDQKRVLNFFLLPFTHVAFYLCPLKTLLAQSPLFCQLCGYSLLSDVCTSIRCTDAACSFGAAKLLWMVLPLAAQCRRSELGGRSAEILLAL